MSKPTIIAIGAAVQDVFLIGKVFQPHREKKGYVEEFILGSKNEVENVVYSTGGGATNASVTFARQGLHSYYMGKIGHDRAGQAALDDLHKDDVDTSLVGYSKKYGTGYSTILLAPTGERTVFTYRGASSHYELDESDFHHSQADWFYISSLSGDIEALKVIVEYAQEHGIKIAINPGGGELSDPAFKSMLANFSILSVNKEEMQQLFEGDDIAESIKKASVLVPLVIVTDGPKGSIASDGKSLYRAGMYEDVKVIDRIGAGDAFSSGFVAHIAKGSSISQAMTFASANSTSVVQQIGAKPGILKASAKLHSMPVSVSDL